MAWRKQTAGLAASVILVGVLILPQPVLRPLPADGCMRYVVVAGRYADRLLVRGTRDAVQAAAERYGGRICESVRGTMHDVYVAARGRVDVLEDIASELRAAGFGATPYAPLELP